jgi:3-phenylpropionate/cinnamic acid dioxygenase small subunit
MTMANKSPARPGRHRKLRARGKTGPRKPPAPGKSASSRHTAARAEPTSRGETAATTRKPRLAQEIVIEGAPIDARTGAQAIAPDHSPRSAPSAEPAVRHTDKPAAAATSDALREIEQLLFRQSELLDGKRWQGYIDLFADDGVYWMPVLPEQTEWEGSPSIFAEDKHMMEVRMGRVSHPTAWSQAPMWGTSHVIGNVVIESESPDAWIVRSRFHMMELRRDTVRHFGGTYRHTLVRERGELKIKLQRVDMFNAQAPYDYVLQVWV